jgi:hypothetical protein
VTLGTLPGLLTRMSRPRAATRDLATEFDRYPDPAFRAGFSFSSAPANLHDMKQRRTYMPRIVGGQVMMPAQDQGDVRPPRLPIRD